jgi:hypothetical protein
LSFVSTKRVTYSYVNHQMVCVWMLHNTVEIYRIHETRRKLRNRLLAFFYYLVPYCYIRSYSVCTPYGTRTIPIQFMNTVLSCFYGTGHTRREARYQEHRCWAWARLVLIFLGLTLANGYYRHMIIYNNIC